MSLINREALYEKACDLEAQALSHVGKIVNDETRTDEWRIWSAILAERTAFKHDIFDAPEVQPEPKWIPCSERLPEKYGWYLCTLKDTRVNTYYWNNKGEWLDNGKKHFFELYNISSRYTGENITAEQEGSVYWTDWVIAWMPLPEPYAERRTDG